MFVYTHKLADDEEEEEERVSFIIILHPSDMWVCYEIIIIPFSMDLLRLISLTLRFIFDHFAKKNFFIIARIY